MPTSSWSRQIWNFVILNKKIYFCCCQNLNSFLSDNYTVYNWVSWIFLPFFSFWLYHISARHLIMITFLNSNFNETRHRKITHPPTTCREFFLITKYTLSINDPWTMVCNLSLVSYRSMSSSEKRSRHSTLGKMTAYAPIIFWTSPISPDFFCFCFQAHIVKAGIINTRDQHPASSCPARFSEDCYCEGCEFLRFLSLKSSLRGKHAVIDKYVFKCSTSLLFRGCFAVVWKSFEWGSDQAWEEMLLPFRSLLTMEQSYIQWISGESNNSYAVKSRVGTISHFPDPCPSLLVAI